MLRVVVYHESAVEDLHLILSRRTRVTANDQLGHVLLLLGPNLAGTAAIPLPLLPMIPQQWPEVFLSEILTDPSCVGPARRAVLDQLERHHGRKFADVWEYQRHKR